MQPQQAHGAARALWAYARDLWRTPGFGDTTDLAHIKAHYYGTHEQINPTGIIPKGPVTDWSAPLSDDLGRDRDPVLL